MTANLPTERAAPKPAIMAGGAVAALVPQSLDEAFRVAQAIAASGLAPKGLDRPEQVMVAIMAGAELGLAPFQALQSFAIVNNRPTLWGDGLMAVARAQGIRANETMEGEGDGTVATCAVTRPDTGEVITRSFSVADAKKAGLWGKAGPWQSYPKRMLQMRARAWALRDGCADMLRGFQVREEVEDYQPVRDVTPPRSSGLAARLNAPQAETVTEGFTAHHPLADDEIPSFDTAPPVSEGPVSDDAEPAAPASASEAGDEFPGDTPSGEPEGAGSDDPAPDPALAKADQTIAGFAFKSLAELKTLKEEGRFKAFVEMLKVQHPAKAAELTKALDDALDAFG
jgi:hypothetical protein